MRNHRDFQASPRAGAARAGLPRASLSRWAGMGLVWLALAWALTACHSAGAGRPPAAPAPAVKLAVEADGIYEAPETLLTAAGLDLTAPDQELLLTNNGRPVGFTLVGQGQDRALRFYGQAAGRDAYSRQNIYWVSRVTPGEALPVQPAAIAVRPAGAVTGAATGAAPAAVVTATVRVEEERQYYSQAGTIGDRWVWQTIFAPAEIRTPITAPHPAAGEASLRLRLVGYSSAPVTPDHHLTLALNDASIADVKWDGLGEQFITATVPAGVLRPGENSLTITAPGDTGAPADSVLLDWVELSYPRELVLDGGSLAFAGQADEFALRVAEKPVALWDITDPARPEAVGDYVSAGDTVRFASDGTPRRFIAVTEAGLLKPVAVKPASGPDPATGSPAVLDDWPGGADLIIVTAPQFRAVLQPLVDARRAQGLRVAVVDVDQVYDSFSHGAPDPEAIRALVAHARTHWAAPAPRYLLLAGDASYDPAGYLKGPEADLVPTQTIHTTFSGLTASDVWYGLADDGPTAMPVVAVGRFPAQTAEQLAHMVNKTLEYERGDRTAAWRDQALLLADGAEPGFAGAAQGFADALTGFVTETITSAGDGSAARGKLLQAFDDGVGLVGYFGHGSVTLWAKEKVFGVEDVAKLKNRDKLPIVFTVTCLSGFFEHPVTPSLGETLLRAGDGGAVAALVPSSAAVLPDQRLLAQGLADALAARSGETPETLGDIVLRAQGALTDPSVGVREVLLTFNLLGDPTLKTRF